MTLARWPSELRRVLTQGYEETSGPSRRFAQTEQGTPRIRRRSSKVASSIGITIRVYNAKRARFWKFYNEEISRGVDAFLMPDPSRDGLVLTDEDEGPALDEDGNFVLDVETWLAEFGEQEPTEHPLGAGLWDISFVILAMPS